MNIKTEEQIFRIRRNLSDAGCDEPLIEQFLELEEHQKRTEQYRLLSGHKRILLQKLHQDQYKIDCLDHMVYTIQQDDNKNGEF